MRAVHVTRSCLFVLLSCVTPALAEDLSSPPVPTLYAAPGPIAATQAAVAAQAVETLAAVAAMRANLAAIVPLTPRTDAVTQSASDFAAHWHGVIQNYAQTQMQFVDAMIAEVTAQNQNQIEDFLTADLLVQNTSLFTDPEFTDPLTMPFDFTNPPLLDAGFFGS